MGITQFVKAQIQNLLRKIRFEVRRVPKVGSEEKGPMILVRLPRYPRERKEDRIALNKLFASPCSSNTILIVSHKEKQCGINQYGENISQALKKSSKYNFHHVLCADVNELNRAILNYNPAAIVYNHTSDIMPWLKNKRSRKYEIVELGIIHEVTQYVADSADSVVFDYHLCPDPTLIERNPLIFKTPRLVPEFHNKQPLPPIVTVGSFGFGFANKGFENLVELVQNEFDEAKIVIRMPFNDLLDRNGHDHAFDTAERCRNLVKKPGIELIIYHDFLDKSDLLEFLGSNTINAFLYTVQQERGISSTVEHALAVGRPLAVNHCNMFRHVHHAAPSICVEEMSLRQIIAHGTAPLEPFKTQWSEANFISAYEVILDEVLHLAPRVS